MRIETGTTYKKRKLVDCGAVEYYWARTIIPDTGAPTDMPWAERKAFNEGVYAWVETTFGEQLDWSKPKRAWMASNNTYYFKKAKDRTMFILRWA